MKEHEIRPPHLMHDKQSLLEADQQFLRDRAQEFDHVPCPACSGDSQQPFGMKHGFSYGKCSCCGTVYMNPRPSQALLHEFYATSKNYAYWNEHIFPATQAVRREQIFIPRAKQVAELCAKFGGKSLDLVEVGAAHGIFCEEAAKLGIFNRVIAVEPHPDQARRCKEKGLEVIALPVERILERAFADVIVAFEVLEHLYCPDDFIKSCVSMLREGGLLMLTCPNVEGFDVKTLGLDSGVFSHEHLNYYHPDSLQLLLEKNGLALQELGTPGKLDADIVRNAVLRGECSLENQPFLRTVLLEKWPALGEAFQNFLAQHGLSSQMLVVARKK